jgi:hypothetical protein
MCAIIFLVLGCYIAYYRSLVKVDTIRSIEQMALYCSVSFTIIGLTHSIFCMYFALAENFFIDEEKYPEYEVHKKALTTKTVSICLQVFFFSLEELCFVLTYKLVK